MVERGRADGPRIAENVLRLAVKVGEFGRVGLCGEDRERCLMSRQLGGPEPPERGECSTYVPGLGRVATEAKTGRVAASDENQPLLRRGCADRWINSQDLFPVLQGDRVLDGLRSLSRSLGCCRIDWRRRRSRNGRGHSSSSLAEEPLDLFEQRDLLFSESQRRQGKHE